MSLELKHLAYYFPYKLKLKGEDGIYTLIELKEPYKTNNKCLLTAECRFENTTRIRSTVFNRDDRSLIPILRPLSDLRKEIEHNGKKFIPKEKLGYVSFDLLYQHLRKNAIHCCYYWVIQILFEWHFDVFGLIQRGLAIDINTLKE